MSSAVTLFVNEAEELQSQLVTKTFGKLRIPVTMHKETEYFWVNPTCEKYDQKWYAFARTQKNAEYITKTAKRLGMREKSTGVPPFFSLTQNYANEELALIHTFRGGSGAVFQFQGTWVHRYIFSNLAQWLDQDFHLDVNIWYDEGMHGRPPPVLNYISESRRILESYTPALMCPHIQVELAKRDASMIARKKFLEKGYYVRRDFIQDRSEKFFAYAVPGMSMVEYKAIAIAAGWNKTQVKSAIKAMRVVDPHRATAYSLETALIDEGWVPTESREFSIWCIEVFGIAWKFNLKHGIDQREPPRGKKMLLKEAFQKTKTSKRKRLSVGN